MLTEDTMPKAKRIPDADVQIAITLASLTYLAENQPASEMREAIVSHLEQPDLPTANKWKVVWGPAVNDPNMWYIARGPNSLGEKSLALVIRGTNMTSLASLRQDAELTLVPFADPNTPADVRIAQGFADAFNRLIAATDAHGVSAFAFLARTLEVGTALDVVGHSLGGAMAPIVALAARRFFAQTKVRAFPFGGQTPGNAAFADWYVESFRDQPSRWINDIDIIPMWYAELDQMTKLYGPSGPPCPDYIKLLVLTITNRHEYAPLRGEHRYRGVQYRKPGSKWFAWEEEASQQHNHLYYMYLTGIPTEVIDRRLGPPWSPPPGPADLIGA
jgi:Lipase (class 3)